MVSLALAVQAGFLLVLASSAVALWYFERPLAPLRGRLRSRLLFGVPWGTLITILGVLLVYLFLQHGIEGLRTPLTLPFFSWSYGYPLGLLTAPFSHGSAGHITGNLLATLVLAPLAEYAWGHFPSERGTSSFGSLRTNPYLRAFVFFPLGVVLVGLLSTPLHWGPVIGFSGVVFAFAGFALVRYPIWTVLALVVRTAVGTAYYALLDPVVVASASTSYGLPSWVGISIQGHLIGLFVGVLLGVLVFARRDSQATAARIWTAVVLVSVSLGLYSLWWYRGNETFVLYRGPGIVFVLGLALFVVLAVRASRGSSRGRVSHRTLAAAMILVPLLVMAVIAVPVNTTTVSGGPPAEQSVAVEGYTVAYGENVSYQRLSSIDLELFSETTQVNTSGVIVVNEARGIWTQVISPRSLAFDDTQTIRVGGVGWERQVTAHREAWTATGGEPAYQVFLQPDGAPATKVFASDPSQAEPVLAGRNVSIDPGPDEFELTVSQNETVVGSGPLPDAGESTTVGKLTFLREDDALLARFQNTTVQIATQQ